MPDFHKFFSCFCLAGSITFQYKGFKMAKQKSTIRKKLPAPNLTIPRSEAESNLYDRIASGEKLLGLSINNENDLEAAKAKRKKWNDHNEALLKRIFDSEAIFEDYQESPLNGTPAVKASWRKRISSFYEGISGKIKVLEIIIQRLEFIPEKIEAGGTQERYAPDVSDGVSGASGQDNETIVSKKETPESAPEKGKISETREKAAPGVSDTVFVIRGQDDEAVVSATEFIGKLGLNAVVLQGKSKAGQTIMDTFDRDAAISGYAVVILEPDDMVALKKDPDDAALRARQNVVFGLGYLCGALGRARVSVLVKEGASIPKDDLGVAYTIMDPGGNWQFSLAKHMKSAGLLFDANRIF